MRPFLLALLLSFSFSKNIAATAAAAPARLVELHAGQVSRPEGRHKAGLLKNATARFLKKRTFGRWASGDGLSNWFAIGGLLLGLLGCSMIFFVGVAGSVGLYALELMILLPIAGMTWCIVALARHCDWKVVAWLGILFNLLSWVFAALIAIALSGD